MKLIDQLKQYNNILLIYDHGLGDFSNWMPLFKELKKILGKRLTLGSPAKRQFNLLIPEIVDTDNIDVRKYDFIYKVSYPDVINSSIPIEHGTESAKPYLCAIYEFGLDNFVWKPYRIKNNYYNKNSKRIGVHLTGGHTGMHCKFCPNSVSLMIWDEIIDEGYEPFEVHMIPKFAYEYNRKDREYEDHLSMINETNSLRFEAPDLQRMIEETGKCKFFIGIDSGPIYLASLLLGCDNIVGLYNQKRHDHFLPKHISMVNVRSYKQGSVRKLIKQKEK